MYYRYPSGEKFSKKLERFFGDDDLGATLTDRINNEFSHLESLFERGISPVDVSEMTTAARYILWKIEEKDPDQYSALLQSIGVGDCQASCHIF